MASSPTLKSAGIPLQHLTPKKAVSKGAPYPVGATPAADGVNSALQSKTAQEVYLVLFDKPNGPRGM